MKFITFGFLLCLCGLIVLSSTAPERVIQEGEVLVVSITGDRPMRVPAVVESVLPNGRLILEGNQRILNNGVESTISVSGTIRIGSIGPDNTVAANQIQDFKLDLKQFRK